MTIRLRHLAPLVLLLAGCTCACAAPATSFTFCYGLERGGSLQAAKDLGLNTLYLDLLPSDLANLQPCIDLARAAQQAGLQVVIGLPTTTVPTCRVSPCDKQYLGSVQELISFAVSRLKVEPAITAWGTGHSLEKYLSFSDDDFRVYLQQGYPSLEALNASWGSTFPTWPSVTMEQARQVDVAAPAHVGRASVDLADYQAWAYQQVMAHWRDAIRDLDPQRPLLTGRISLYRSLVSVPDGYDVVCVSMPPDVLEADLQAHNVQAIDLARRGGRFRALPVLRTPYTATAAYTDEAVRDWIQQGALHGSAGFALEDWRLVADIYQIEIERRTERRARHLVNSTTAGSALRFDFMPAPTTAIIYSPYAEGFQVTKQPVYGYLPEFLTGEPAGLMYALRLGSRYGPVDYLSVEDLREADLRRYGTILLPACLRLPRQQTNLLDEYVQAGGTVLADLGLGMYETGSWLTLPEPWMENLGLVELGELKERVGDLSVAAPLTGLALPRGMKSQGVFSGRTNATGPATDRKLWTVSGPVAEARLTETAAPVATLSVRFDEDKRPIFAGLIGRQAGAGLGLFATHPLWQYWPLTDPLSSALHGNLLSRRAKYELVQPGLLQGNLQMAGNAAEVAVLNLRREDATAQLWAYGAGSRAYSGAVTNFMAAPLQQGLPAGSGMVLAAVPARTLVRLARTGLVVQPYADDATVQIQEYAPQKLVFSIHGAGATARMGPRGGLDIDGGAPTNVRLILGNCLYAVTPGSLHQVSTATRGGRAAQTVLTANERGELDLSRTYRQETLTLTPLPSPR